MEKLNLHSSGENDYLKLLKKKFDKIVFEITGNEKLSDSEKRTELVKTAEHFEKEKKEARRGLY
jgi:hypothetical protein